MASSSSRERRPRTPTVPSVPERSERRSRSRGPEMRTPRPEYEARSHRAPSPNIPNTHSLPEHSHSQTSYLRNQPVYPNYETSHQEKWSSPSLKSPAPVPAFPIVTFPTEERLAERARSKPRHGSDSAQNGERERRAAEEARASPITAHASPDHSQISQTSDRPPRLKKKRSAPTSSSIGVAFSPDIDNEPSIRGHADVKAHITTRLEGVASASPRVGATRSAPSSPSPQENLDSRAHRRSEQRQDQDHDYRHHDSRVIRATSAVPVTSADSHRLTSPAIHGATRPSPRSPDPQDTQAYSSGRGNPGASTGSHSPAIVPSSREPQRDPEHPAREHRKAKRVRGMSQSQPRSSPYTSAMVSPPTAPSPVIPPIPPTPAKRRERKLEEPHKSSWTSSVPSLPLSPVPPSVMTPSVSSAAATRTPITEYDSAISPLPPSAKLSKRRGTISTRVAASDVSTVSPPYATASERSFESRKAHGDAAYADVSAVRSGMASETKTSTVYEDNRKKRRRSQATHHSMLPPSPPERSAQRKRTNLIDSPSTRHSPTIKPPESHKASAELPGENENRHRVLKDTQNSRIAPSNQSHHSPDQTTHRSKFDSQNGVKGHNTRAVPKEAPIVDTYITRTAKIPATGPKVEPDDHRYSIESLYTDEGSDEEYTEREYVMDREHNSDRATPTTLANPEQQRHDDLLAGLGLSASASNVGLGLTITAEDNDDDDSYDDESERELQYQENMGRTGELRDIERPLPLAEEEGQIGFISSESTSVYEDDGKDIEKRHSQEWYSAEISRPRYRSSPALDPSTSKGQPTNIPYEEPASASGTGGPTGRPRRLNKATNAAQSNKRGIEENHRDGGDRKGASSSRARSKSATRSHRSPRSRSISPPVHGRKSSSPVSSRYGIAHHVPQHQQDYARAVASTRDARPPSWSESEVLSPGAQQLFSQLRNREPQTTDPPNQVQAADSHAQLQYLESRPQPRIELQPDVPKSPSEQPPARKRPPKVPTPYDVSSYSFGASRTWRENLSLSAYDNLVAQYGIIEMKRQDVIWELSETEVAFAQSMNLILRLFVQPLRSSSEGSGKWIPGLPREPMKLFDWLDDISQLHTHICSALHRARSAEYPVVIHFAEHLRPFVSRLELHQPYLARLESITEEIDKMLRDPSSDFGEYLRLQSANPECDQLGLCSSLMQPVQRLMKYPLLFRQLFDLTPRNHPDHLATFSLFHSTELIIKVMQEVKTREEEYDYIKALSGKIAGMPPDFVLARRERRLVAQGLLRRVPLNDRERASLDGYTPAVANLEDARSSQDAAFSPPGSQPPSPRAHGADLSKLGPITSPYFSSHQPQSGVLPPSAYHYSRRSYLSTTSRASAMSDVSEWTTSYSAASVAVPGDVDTALRPDSTASSIAPHPFPFVSQAKNSTSSYQGQHNGIKSQLRDSSLYAFVFSDLVLLTTSNPEKQRSLHVHCPTGVQTDGMQLLEHIGISRVLGVADYSGSLDMDHFFAVDLLPMPQDKPDPGLLAADASSATPIYLTLPDASNGRLLAAPQALVDAKLKWITAFQRCFRYTLRSLSFPSMTRYDVPSDELGLSGHSRSSVMSILASGLPLPKSPSQQIFTSAGGASSTADMVEGEREERGWWSLRFKQVLREMEKSDDPVMLIGESSLTMGLRPKHAQGPERAKRSGIQPLLLQATVPSANSKEAQISGRKNILGIKRR